MYGWDERLAIVFSQAGVFFGWVRSVFNNVCSFFIWIGEGGTVIGSRFFFIGIAGRDWFGKEGMKEGGRI